MGIESFVRESNRIEGILRDPTRDEIEAHERFMRQFDLTVISVRDLVSVLQPNAVLRNVDGLNVRVGNHIAPRGGPAIETRLRRLLNKINAGHYQPFFAHHKYETLHPFTDGNGRSGRAIWLWQMYRLGNDAPLGFLHHWYYQSLSDRRASRPRELETARADATP